MDLFNIIVGVSSIGSFVIAIIALSKVNRIENSQSIENNKINESSVTQTGRDYKGG